MPASRSPSRDAKPDSAFALVLAGRSHRPCRGARRDHCRVARLASSRVSCRRTVHAEDFSGSLWHGSAGKISVNARDAGALEWRLHPAALLGMAVAADLHWVKVGFVLDGCRQHRSARRQRARRQGRRTHRRSARFGRRGGMARHGGHQFQRTEDRFCQAAGRRRRPPSVESHVARKSPTARIWEATICGCAAGAVDGDGNVTAQLTDTGGPWMCRPSSLSAKERTGILTGTLRERPERPPRCAATWRVSRNCADETRRDEFPWIWSSLVAERFRGNVRA